MNWRFRIIMIFVLLCGGGILVRLFSLQILNYSRYHALAQDLHQFYQTLHPERGEIYLRDLSGSSKDDVDAGSGQYVPLALNKEFFQIYLVPKSIKEEKKDEVADKLSSLLGLEKGAVLEKLEKKDDPYEPLKHKVGEEVVSQVRDLDIDGVGVSDETWRYYPNHNLASHLVGFVGDSEKGQLGQYGLEGYYEEELKGESGSLSGEKDIAGYKIPFLDQQLEPAQDGSDIYLTIDQNIQFKAEKELKQAIEDWQAESGTIIVMEPKTGVILAMVSWPEFDPNEYNKVENANVFANPATQKIYEPGSVFKPLTMAIAIESGKITPQTTYEDKGLVQIGRTVIGNVDRKSYGLQTMTQALEKSLNTGAIFAQQAAGMSAFREYLKKFDFDKPTGIDLAGEAGGNIINIFTNQEVTFANMSFGQGIAMTPLKLISALSAIANSGKIMQPFVVQKIIGYDGESIETVPQISKEIFSPETAEKLTKMMISVVEEGFGKNARVEGYSVAGKTGTAQIPDSEKGGYLEEDTIHTFIGFAPAFNPRFIILVKLDKPKETRFASTSTTTVFSRIAEYLFNYLRIPPQ